MLGLPHASDEEIELGASGLTAMLVSLLHCSQHGRANIGRMSETFAFLKEEFSLTNMQTPMLSTEFARTLSTAAKEGQHGKLVIWANESGFSDSLVGRMEQMAPDLHYLFTK